MPPRRSFKRTEDVTTVLEAEEYRNGLFSEFSAVLRKLHDPETLVENLRELNESANKLLKTRKAWEHRIKELGGPDHLQTSSRFQQGTVNINGFRYFGRSKDLLDIAQLIESQKKSSSLSSKEDPEILNEKKIKALNQIKFESSYYGNTSSMEPQSSKLLPFDENLVGLTNKEIEQIVVERKRSQLLAKLELKNN